MNSVLHVVSRVTHRLPLPNALIESARSGADVVQIREKKAPASDTFALVRQLQSAFSEHNLSSQIFVNERVDVAICSSVSGVHLAAKSLPISVVDGLRRQSGRSGLIGYSVHALDEARLAEQTGADYVTFGHIYASESRLGGGYAPVKGQLLAIRPRQGARLHHTVFSDHVYLVPKRDGSVIVGATEDRDAGFNKDVTIDAMITLLSAVARIAPGYQDAVFERSWMGLRPGSPTGAPSIGELPDFPGLHVAVGHFRNGTLLSPVTGEMMVQSVAGKPWPARWEAFRAAHSH